MSGYTHPASYRGLDGARIVLGVTGSIAAYKSASLVRLLLKAGAEVQPLMTHGAAAFISPVTMGALAKKPVLTDVLPESASRDEGSWTEHVTLGLWADGLVVAPCSAHTLATLAHGSCDSMLAATILSARCPILVAPAMDHDMWHHPATQANVETLRGYGYTVLDPAHGELASGLVGEGRLPEPEELVAAIAQWLERERSGEQGSGSRDRGSGKGKSSPYPLSGKKVLVTAGPTREAIDPVRFLSNGSTGTMGFALAAAAAARGAEVVLVSGPVSLATPPGVTRIDITTADELHDAALQHADADLVIAAAAVADYAPASPSDQKQKKEDAPGDTLTLTLRRTPDVLAALGAQKKDGQVLIGFALETQDGEDNARRKLEQKHLDWIALNYANETGSGFGAGTNRLLLLGSKGEREELGPIPKQALAHALLDHLLDATG